MDRWTGRVAVITGASSGIGAALVGAFLRSGFKVVGLARRLDRMETLARVASGSVGEGVFHPVQCDVTREDDIISAFAWIKDTLGGVDVLVNCAGVGRCSASLCDGSTEDYRAMLDTNVLAVCICTREAVRSMRARGIDDGHVFHIGSVAGHYVPRHAAPIMNVYAATKHAVNALTETLRQELSALSTRIRVTSISPGAVDTELRVAGGIPADVAHEMISKVPHLRAEDVADAVLYALNTPTHVQIHNIMIRAVGEAY